MSLDAVASSGGGLAQAGAGPKEVGHGSYVRRAVHLSREEVDAAIKPGPEITAGKTSSKIIQLLGISPGELEASGTQITSNESVLKKRDSTKLSPRGGEPAAKKEKTESSSQNQEPVKTKKSALTVLSDTIGAVFTRKRGGIPEEFRPQNRDTTSPMGAPTAKETITLEETEKKVDVPKLADDLRKHIVGLGNAQSVLRGADPVVTEASTFLKDRISSKLMNSKAFTSIKDAHAQIAKEIKANPEKKEELEQPTLEKANELWNGLTQELQKIISEDKDLQLFFHTSYEAFLKLFKEPKTQDAQMKKIEKNPLTPLSAEECAAKMVMNMIFLRTLSFPILNIDTTSKYCINLAKVLQNAANLMVTDLKDAAASSNDFVTAHKDQVLSLGREFAGVLESAKESKTPGPETVARESQVAPDYAAPQAPTRTRADRPATPPVELEESYVSGEEVPAPPNLSKLPEPIQKRLEYAKSEIEKATSEDRIIELMDFLDKLRKRADLKGMTSKELDNGLLDIVDKLEAKLNEIKEQGQAP